MVNKTKLGLAGLVLATTLNTNLFSQKAQRQYIDGTINGIEYSDKKIGENVSYALEEQVLFGKMKKDIPVVFGRNPEIDNGELDFYICPINELSIAYGKDKVEIIPKMYIPTQAIDFSNRRITKMELTGINTLVNKQLKKKSENSFGYNQTRTEKDIEGILPRINHDGQEYSYWMATKGKFITQNNQELIAEMINGKSLDLVLFPITNEYKEIIDLSCGNITIESPTGIYLLGTEEIQDRIDKKQTTQKNSKNIPNKNTPRQEKFPNQNEEKNCTYIVKQGETFWGISERFYNTGKDTQKLMDLNGYKKPEDLKAGDILKVPCEKEL
jgi:LysM repeat protein